MADEPEVDGPVVREEWVGGLKFRIMNWKPSEDDLRQIRNQVWALDLNRRNADSMLRRAFANSLASCKDPHRQLPDITSTESADYKWILDRAKDPDDPLKAGLVSDYPVRAVDLAKHTGSKSRNSYQSLIRKGLLHSYGKGKGAVPAWVRRRPPNADRLEWYGLTELQRRILFLFRDKTWCCRSAEFETAFLKCRTWSDAELRDGAVGLLGPEIAAELGRGYEGDNHLRDELARLVRLKILVRGRTSKRRRTRVGYLPNPRAWPFDARALPFCPLVDRVNAARRWRGQDDLPIA